MERTIDEMTKKLYDIAYKLKQFYEEKDERDKRKAFAHKRLEKSVPIERTTVAYCDTELGKKISTYRQTLRGNLTLENVDYVGGLVLEEFKKFYDESGFDFEDETEKLNQIGKEYDRLKRELDTAKQKNFAGYMEYVDYRHEKINAINDVAGRWRASNNEIEQKRLELANKAKTLLKSIRASTNLGRIELKKQLLTNSNSVHAPAIIEALQDYPKEMVDGLIKNIGPFSIDAKSKRGYWSLARKEIAVCKRKATAYHELGHAMEAACPCILNLEMNYYNKRTAGCKLESLREVTKIKYDWSEKTRKDSFVRPYIGKDYEGTAYELVSMGFEMFFSKPDELMKDKDFFKFITGILCTVTP